MQKQKQYSFVKGLIFLLLPLQTAFSTVSDVSSISEKVVGDTVDHSEFNSIVEVLKGFFNENSGSSVGIGSTPTSALKLDVDGKVGATEYCNEDGTVCTASDSIGAKFFDGIDTADAVFSGGNVGIGILSPENGLHIRGDAIDNSQLLLERTSGAIGKYRLGIAGGSNRFYIHDAAQDLTRLSIDASGNVGIGTTSPSEKLEISGKIKATSINFSGIPTSTTGLSSGDVWSDGGILKIMP